MTREVAVLILEKEINCFCTHPSNCAYKCCLNCESYVEDDDLREAMRVAVDILKSGKKAGKNKFRDTLNGQGVHDRMKKIFPECFKEESDVCRLQK